MKNEGREREEMIDERKRGGGVILGSQKIFSLGSGGIRRRKGRKGDREERETERREGD